jgi:hypothetical protein
LGELREVDMGEKRVEQSAEGSRETKGLDPSWWDHLPAAEKLRVLKSALLGYQNRWRSWLRPLPAHPAESAFYGSQGALSRMRESWAAQTAQDVEQAHQEALEDLRSQSRVRPIKEWKGGRG